jgi:hypothetical protein
MTARVPNPLPAGGYEQYRKVRSYMLRTYALAYLRQEPRLPAIVGIATEPLLSDSSEGRSEDLLYAEQPEWTPELIADLEKDQKTFDVLRPGRIKVTEYSGDEYPEVPAPVFQQFDPFWEPPPPNRKQRRAAEARRRSKRH